MYIFRVKSIKKKTDEEVKKQTFLGPAVIIAHTLHCIIKQFKSNRAETENH